MKKPALPNIDFQEVIEDFRRLNPNDPGAWPLVPKVVMLVGLFVLLIAAGWWFVWQDRNCWINGRYGMRVTIH